MWNKLISAGFAGSRLQLAYYLGQFKAYENRFIHITQADAVEAVADYVAHPTVTVFQTDAGKENQTVKANVCPAGQTLSPNAHQQGKQTPGGKRLARGGEVITRYVNHRAHYGNYPYRKKATLSPKKRWQKFQMKTSFDFGSTLVRCLWIRWDIFTIINGIRGGEKCRPTYAACFLLACQPPTDLAINLQYKRSLISGSLILKWIIIWLCQSSLLNVKCLQFVKWPPFQPWSETCAASYREASSLGRYILCILR